MSAVKQIKLQSSDIVNTNHIIGQAYPLKYFNTHIDKNTDCFLDGKLLFSFRKNSICNNTVFDMLQKNIVQKFLNSDHRKTAGGTNKRVVISSGVLGYYDKLTPQMKTKLGGINQAGRQTAFVKHCPDKWSNLLPIFQQISRLYKKTCPKHYNVQKQFISTIHDALHIDDTVFTTITMNKNFRTSSHTDKGDFEKGMSCLAIIGKDYQGGYLGFPRLGIVVYTKPGDVIFMNAHEPHCNTEFDIDIKEKGKGIRYSIVCYLRTNLHLFHKKKIVDNDTYFIE